MEESQSATIDASRPDSGRRLPTRGVTQVVLVVWAYVGYTVVRNLVTSSRHVAFDHARDVLALEHTLGLGVEHGVQQLALHSRFVVDVCNVVYSATHQAAPVVALVILYFKLPARYARWRDGFLVMLGLALVGFWLYPLMPPRLMPSSLHFVDTSQFFTLSRASLRGVAGGSPDPTRSNLLQYSNPYAALPSLHVAWVLFVSAAVWPLARRRSVKALLVLYPALMGLAVVVTANHWVVDVVAGIAVLACSMRAATVWIPAALRRTGFRDHRRRALQLP